MNFSEDIAIFRPSHIEKVGGLTRGWRPRSKNPFRIKLVPSEGSDVALGTLVEVKGTPASEHTTETMFVKVGEWSEEIFATIAANGITQQGVTIYAAEMEVKKSLQDIDYFIATVVGVYGKPVRVLSSTGNVTKMEVDGVLMEPAETITFMDNATHIVKLWMDVTELPAGVFSDTDIRTIELPRQVTNLGGGSLSHMEKLVEVVAYNPTIDVDYSALFNTYGATVYANGDGLVPIVLSQPDIIYKTASGEAIDVGTLAVKSNTYVDGEGAIFLEDGVSAIPLNWLKENTDILSIDIGNKITQIGTSAFQGCTALTTATLPNSITHIGSNAFLGCTALTTATLPNSITYIGNSAFQGCTNLGGELNLPNLEMLGVTSQQSPVGNNFNGTKITAIRRLGTITQIGSSAFQGCTALTTATLPNSITQIGTGAFLGCTALDTFVCHAVVPPTIVTNTFYSVKQDMAIKVPAASVEDYKTAAVWIERADYISAI